MATKTNETLPGIIGQCYEDRRNGEFGILISRDTKCKTMNYQREDGTEFVRSYSHFRSYMRKKADAPAETIKEEAYAEAELTSIEVSDEDAVKMEKNAKRKANAEKKAEEAKTSRGVKAMSDEDKNDVYVNMASIIESFVDSFNNPSVVVQRRDYKKACSLKVCGRSMLILYSRARVGKVYITSVPELITGVKHSVELKEIKHHSAKTANYRTESYVIDVSDLKANLEDLREAIIEIVSYKKESEE